MLKVRDLGINVIPAAVAGMPVEEPAATKYPQYLWTDPAAVCDPCSIKKPTKGGKKPVKPAVKPSKKGGKTPKKSYKTAGFEEQLRQHLEEQMGSEH